MHLLEEFAKRIRDEGIYSASCAASRYLRWKARSRFGYVERVDERRQRLNREIDDAFGSTVAYGPFEGLKLAPRSWWGGTDRAAMIFGIYEQEVLEALIEAPPERRVFVDLGAADGYYGIGAIVSGRYDRSYCFERSQKGRQVIQEAARLNGVEDRLKIKGTATAGLLDEIDGESAADLVLLVDIEGAEFDLFQASLLEKLQNAIVVIELHDGLVKDGAAKAAALRSNAERYFTVSELTTTARDLSAFPELRDYADDDRWLLCSEGRPHLMTWLRLDPKFGSR